MEEPKTVNLLKRLRRNASLSMYAHFGAAERNAKANLFFGLPVLVLNLILGSMFVALISENLGDIWKWISAILSLVSAFFAALLTFFKPQQGKLKHRELANRYLSIDRDAERTLAEFDDKLIDLRELAKRTATFNTEYNAINRAANDYPTSDRDFNRAKRKIKGKNEPQSKNDGALGEESANSSP